MKLRQYTRKWFSLCTDLMIPHLCISCADPADWSDNPALCQKCKHVTWMKPRCKRCAHNIHPIESRRRRCQHCKHISLPFYSLSSIGPYQNWLRKAITQFKFNQDELACRFLIRLLKEVKLEPFLPGDVLTYIPSHQHRLKERGARTQHMEELLQVFRKTTSVSPTPLLKKVKYSLPQLGLCENERRKNVSESFQYIGPESPPKNIHLFDDVWTTGSTMKEACRCLKSAGVEKIYCHVIALTPSFREAPAKVAENQSRIDD